MMVYVACILSLALPLSAEQPGSSGGGGLMDLMGLFMGPAPSESKHSVTFVEGDREAADEILLIKVKGIISESEDKDGLPFEMKKDLMESVRKDLECARERSQIKAVLLEIDSPGGEVTASDILHHRIQKLRDVKKPVVALIGGLGASGGYYLACAAEKILAHPTSILGSIGVIMRTANIEKLAGMIGIRDVSLKSDRTPKKDVLSPFREMTPEEKAMLMSLIDSMYDRFVKIVAAARKKDVKEIEPLADGGIYTSQQALDKGLIDAIGYREDAITAARELAGLKTARLVKRKTKKSLPELIMEMGEMRSGLPTLLGELRNALDARGTPSLRYQLDLDAPDAR